MPRLLIVSTISIALRSFLLPYARHFRGLGWKVDGAARGISEDPECAAAFDRTWNIDWSRNPSKLPNLRRAALQVAELVESQLYDIVHVHTPVAAFVTRFALRGLRRKRAVKIIYTAHGFHFHNQGSQIKNAVFAALERLAGKWTDYLVVINREDERAAAQHGILPAARIKYMPGIGVDWERYASHSVSLAEIAGVQKELGVDSDLILLQIAEFNPGKRHSDVLLAFAGVRTPAKLVFAGTGPQMEPTRKLADDLGLSRRVHFLGFRTDIPALICASRATVLPSEREGLPRSVMESLCLGIPVIGSNIRGTAELIADGAGISVPLGDIAALTQAMETMLNNAELASRMGARGRARMAQYDIRRILEMHEALYAEALNGTESVLDAYEAHS